MNDLETVGYGGLSSRRPVSAPRSTFLKDPYYKKGKYIPRLSEDMQITSDIENNTQYSSLVPLSYVKNLQLLAGDVIGPSQDQGCK